MTYQVLVPVEVLEGGTLSQGVVEALGGLEVMLAGYHVVPDQTTPEQARDQFGERAEERLDEIAAVLEEAGATVESTMVFTHDEKKTIERLREEHEPEAILHHHPSVEFDSVFVPLHPEFTTERIAGFVAELLVDEDAKVYVRGYGEDGNARARTFEGELEDQRVERAQTVYDAAELEGFVASASEDADEHSMVVVQRRDEGLKQKLADAAFGTIGERVAEASRRPVFEML